MFSSRLAHTCLRSSGPHSACKVERGYSSEHRVSVGNVGCTKRIEQSKTLLCASDPAWCVLEALCAAYGVCRCVA